MQVLRISLVCMLLASTGCAMHVGKPRATPIPDAESPPARLYAERCGACHVVPHPARLTYSGWVRLLPLMERHMAECGLPPLSEAERNEILAYLKAHAR